MQKKKNFSSRKNRNKNSASLHIAKINKIFKELNWKVKHLFYNKTWNSRENKIVTGKVSFAFWSMNLGLEIRGVQQFELQLPKLQLVKISFATVLMKFKLVSKQVKMYNWSNIFFFILMLNNFDQPIKKNLKKCLKSPFGFDITLFLLLHFGRKKVNQTLMRSEDLQ